MKKTTFYFQVLTIAIISCKSEPKEKSNRRFQVRKLRSEVHIRSNWPLTTFKKECPLRKWNENRNYFKRRVFKTRGTTGQRYLVIFSRCSAGKKFTGTPSEKMTISGGKTPIVLNYLDWLLLHFTQKIVPNFCINWFRISPLQDTVLSAQNMGWNDLWRVRLGKVKTAVVLINESWI